LDQCTLYCIWIQIHLLKSLTEFCEILRLYVTFHQCLTHNQLHFFHFAAAEVSDIPATDHAQITHQRRYNSKLQRLGPYIDTLALVIIPSLPQYEITELYRLLQWYS